MELFHLVVLVAAALCALESLEPNPNSDCDCDDAAAGRVGETPGHVRPNADPAMGLEEQGGDSAGWDVVAA
jgi:hypothetical protein